MMRRVVGCGPLVIASLLLFPAPSARALPPFSFLPFRRIEADPAKSYELTREQGPWMILASSFAGPGARQQAQELVVELRARYKLPAYVHHRSYDFTEPVVGLGVDEYGGAKIMKHKQAVKFQEFAVLVGDFTTIDDPALEKTLSKIKYARPGCLDIEKNRESTQRFVGLRHLQRAISGDEAKRNKGPMGSAFVTRNPLLPKEYFGGDSLDDFVINMNRGVKYSLLDNPAEYSVRVATFRGDTRLELDREHSVPKDPSNKLAEAAENAHRLTLALREQGIEAYEFHDRHESIVAVGSFDSVGEPRADGKLEIDEKVHQIMRIYGARRQRIPGQDAAGLQPRRLNGIPFDVQPIPVQVPRRSLGSEIAHRR